MAREQDIMVRLPLVGELTYREVHALIDGVFAGYVDERAHDYTQERHYWRAGWLAGQWLRGGGGP